MNLDVVTAVRRTATTAATVVDHGFGFGTVLERATPAAAGTSGGAATESGGDAHAPAAAYDFSRISPRQMALAIPTLGMAGGAVSAISDLIGDAASDRPVNMFAYLKHEAAANEKAGSMDVAFHQRAVLAVLTRLQRDAGVPIRYDDDYPTAPRTTTAPQVTARLQSAIADFRKQAQLTPAQRLAKALRQDVLREMKLAEDDIQAMSPDRRAAIERKIGDEVARRMALLGFSGADGKGAGSGDEAAAGVSGDPASAGR